jgi:single-strand DNA-binding protein
MFHLNSVLVEGTMARRTGVKFEPGAPDKAAKASFWITSKRGVIDLHGEVKEADTFTFEVRAGHRLAEMVKELAREGRGVRVVGRIESEYAPDEEDPKTLCYHVYIVAEHIEWRPEFGMREERK